MPLGAYSAQVVLKQTMSFLGAYVMWQPEIYFNFSAYIDEKADCRNFKNFMQDF